MTRYRDINLLQLLFADPQVAESFVEYELRELAREEPGMAELRRTLAVFLDSHNIQATAAALFVARNTVNYRLQKIETLLEQRFSERQLELRVALYLYDNSRHRAGLIRRNMRLTR